MSPIPDRPENIPHVRPQIGPYVPPPCRKPLPDREPEGLRLWTVDMCANVVFAPAKRPMTHYPPGQPIPRRRWEFRSVRPIRAKGFGLPDGGGEVCRYHYAGPPVKGPDNRWRIVFCTRPAVGMWRHSIGHVFVEPKGPPPGALPRPQPLMDTLIKPGRAGVFAGYQTPFWTEMIVHSAVRLCDPFPV